MANFEQLTETVQRIQFRLETPSNAVELDKMMHAASTRLRRDRGAICDDSITVRVEDDTIIAEWEEVQLNGELT